MRKGQVVRLTSENSALAPGIAVGEPLKVRKGFWCDFHNEGCLLVERPDGDVAHVPDVLFEITPRT